MNKRTFYKERKINNRCFDFLSKQNIKVPLILDINDNSVILNLFKTKAVHILLFCQVSLFMCQKRSDAGEFMKSDIDYTNKNFRSLMDLSHYLRN